MIHSPGVAVIQYGVDGEQLTAVASHSLWVPDAEHRIPVTLLLLLVVLMMLVMVMWYVVLQG